MRPRNIALACAAAALAVCGGAAAAVVSERGSVSALVHMSRTEPMAELAFRSDPSFAFVDVQSHYDGVYFYAMARDPFALGVEHTKLDRAAYRYGHVGYAWLAALASFGHASAIPPALLVIGLIGAGIGGFAASRLAGELGWSPWWGLLVAFSPGLVFAVTVDTSEPVAFAFTVLALLAWTRRRSFVAGLLMSAACLTKEPLLLVPVGLGVWEAVNWWRNRSPGPDLVPRLTALAIGPVIFLGWYLYLRSAFGLWPFVQETKDYFAIPFVGWWNSMRSAAALAAGPFYPNQIGNAAIPLLAIIAAALTIGLVRSVRFRSFIQPVFLLMAILILSLNSVGVLYPKDLMRESAVTMLLLPAAIAGRREERDPFPN
jgi:hypothetical protein